MDSNKMLANQRFPRRGVLGIGIATLLGGCVRSTRDQFSDEKDVEIQSEDLVINISGFQYGWEFDYEEYDIAVGVDGELVLPVGQPIAFRVTSEDVEHAFDIPDLEVTVPAVPDETAVHRIKLEETAERSIDCGVDCGPGTDQHVSTLQIVSEDRFNEWLESQ